MSTKSKKPKKVIFPATISRMAAFQAAKVNMFAQARTLKGMGPGGQQAAGGKRIGVVKRGSR